MSFVYSLNLYGYLFHISDLAFSAIDFLLRNRAVGCTNTCLWRGQPRTALTAARFRAGTFRTTCVHWIQMDFAFHIWIPHLIAMAAHGAFLRRLTAAPAPCARGQTEPACPGCWQRSAAADESPTIRRQVRIACRVCAPRRGAFILPSDECPTRVSQPLG